MLIWLVATLALAGVLLSARWYAERSGPAARRRPYPLTAVLCLEFAALAAVPVLRTAGEEHRLGQVASTLAGVHATVHCQRLASSMVDATSDLGHVRAVNGRPEHATLIKNEQCKLLATYLAGDYRHPSMDEVVAVHVLTHESMHMAGITDEAIAECAAVQRDARTAQLLGATPTEARELAVRYWRLVYPFMPPDYRTPECAPGGRLDEQLPTAPWAAGPATVAGQAG